MNSVRLVPHSSPWITDLDTSEVVETLQSGLIAKGQKTIEFEAAIRDFLGSGETRSYSSGRDALVAALRRIGIEDEDEVIVPTYVCKEVLDAVIEVGGNPQIADVGLYGVLTPDAVRDVLSSKTRAIVGVHIFGHYCDIEGLKSFGLPVIEDACHAFGVTFEALQEKRAGTLGHYAVLSFHATKLLTTGSGGMLVINRGSLGFENGVEKSPESGIRGSFSDLNASLGLSQLRQFPDFVHRRQWIREEYRSAVGHNVSDVSDPVVPHVKMLAKGDPVPHLFLLA